MISRVTITAVVAWMSVAVLFRHFYSEAVRRKEGPEDIHTCLHVTGIGDVIARRDSWKVKVTP